MADKDDASRNQPTDTTNESEASNPKKRKVMRPRSSVWEHFTDENGKVRAKCTHCGRDYSADPTSNGTTGLHTHLKSCKSYNLQGRQTELAFQSGKDGDLTSLGVWKFDNDLVREKFTKMIIVDELPFKFVEGLGFREFMAACQPKFNIPSRWTVARDCYGMYANKKSTLKDLLHEPSQHICFTTDTWTSNQRINYMCLTAHFIDKNWKMHKRILNFIPITSHKGEAIGLAIEKCLRDWEITRVLSVTVDNASSNDVAVLKLKNKISNWETSVLNCEHLHMRCVAHILNLIVQDGLKVFNESITRVRNAVRYVRQSPARLKRFKECVEFEKIESKKSSCLDVPTRWNSTYKMLEVAEKFERAFDRYDEQDPRFKFDLQVEIRDICVDGRPTFNDWITVRQFALFLKVFYDMTLKISGTSYVTSNLFLHEIYAVHAILHNWSYGSNDMYLIGVKMLEKFKKYWGDPTKMNNLLFIAVVLDPRHKLKFVIYMQHMYEEEVGGEMGRRLEETLFKMFNEYKSRMDINKEKGDSRESLSAENSGPVHPSLQLRLQFERDSGIISFDGSSSDLDEYLSEKPKTFKESDEFDILGWWRLNSMRFPILSQMARDIGGVWLPLKKSDFFKW